MRITKGGTPLLLLKCEPKASTYNSSYVKIISSDIKRLPVLFAIFIMTFPNYTRSHKFIYGLIFYI